MSSDSDSDDNIKMKQFLEAVDTTLLNDSLFEGKLENKIVNEPVSTDTDTLGIKKDVSKSQRYIPDDNESFCRDFNLPESTQKHLAKKLNEILESNYEFYDAAVGDSIKMKAKYKNRVKLLKGADCYVNAYEDFKDDIKRPTKKPVFKRRIIDGETDHCLNEEDKLKLVAIDGNFILSYEEVKKWTNKKERKDKVFCYKMASNGVLNAKEEENEFTKMRLKNKWNESKIKNFKKR